MAILIVEDDAFYANRLAEMLNDRGIATINVHTAEEALKVDASEYDASIIDVMLPNDPMVTGITAEESRGGYMTGIALARRLRRDRPSLNLVLITADVWNSEAVDWAATQGIPIVKKYEARRLILEALQRAGLLPGDRTPKAFIVHGHDEAALLQLKNYIQNVLRWQEPVVLREQPNGGRTLIEKFEDYAEKIDCVFVLLTPDDPSGPPVSKDPRRSRQNVIFELGFFLGQLGRVSGRIVVLHKGPNELPSDIQGVVWIGIDNAVDAAGEQIRREVAQLGTRA
jgi:predicted nucleotide-binding protein